MDKKFTIGLIALLGVSLFFLGCDDSSDDSTPSAAEKAATDLAGSEDLNNKVEISGATVTLKENVTLTKNIEVKEGVTLDVAGKELKVDPGKKLTVAGTVKVGSGGTLTAPELDAITGLPTETSGEIAFTGEGAVVLENGATGRYGTKPFISTGTTGYYQWDSGDTTSTVTLTNLKTTLKGKVTARENTGVAGGTEIVIDGTSTLTVNADVTFGVAGTLTVEDGGKVILASDGTNGATFALEGGQPSGGKLTGGGKVVAGATEIVGGTGGWQAVGAGYIAIAVGTTTDAKTASITAATSVLTAGAGATITQLAVADNLLTVAENTTINLGGTATKLGEIVLKNSGDNNTNNSGKLTLAAETSIIKTGNPSATAPVTAVALSNDYTTVAAISNAYTKIGVALLVGDGTHAKLEPTNASSNNTSVAGKIVKLIGGGSGTDATIIGGDTSNTADGTKDGRISGETATVADSNGE